MIISTATKSLCKRCNADMKEKLACEIYELITAPSCLLFLIAWVRSELSFLYVMRSTRLCVNPVDIEVVSMRFIFLSLIKTFVGR